MAERQHHVFVVRIWREPSARDATWRGSVYEPTSTRRVASTNLHDLWDFITIRLRSAAPSSGLRETQADGQKDALPARPARSPHEQDPPDDHQPRNRRRRSDD